MPALTLEDFLTQWEKKTTIDALAGPGQPKCGIRVPSGKFHNLYWICTRPAGHGGLHVASAGAFNWSYADYQSIGTPHVAWDENGNLVVLAEPHERLRKEP